MDLKEIITEIFRIIYIILILFVAYQVLRAIFGGTRATENIIIAGMGIILAGMFAIVGFLINQEKCLGMLEERTKNIGDSLINLGKDFKHHLQYKR
jgi:multisubunit Na+/H+ antiporter MnhF subunit